MKINNLKYIAFILFVVFGCSNQSTDQLQIKVSNLAVVQNKFESITIDEITEDIQETIVNYLPNEISQNDTININFIESSDRGSYANNDSIIIDLSDLEVINYNQIKNIITHEVHHILYMNWLLKTVRNKPKNDNQLVLSWWQYRIIMEGIAQQINFIDYPEPIQKLYANKDLLKELLDFWVSNQREIVSSNTPKLEYSEIQNYMWSKWSREKLKEYLPGLDEFSQHRPTVNYYLGYHFYSTIKTYKGNDGFSEVIRNPKCLLRTYNSIEERCLTIPEDIIELWEINYRENPVNKI